MPYLEIVPVRLSGASLPSEALWIAVLFAAALLGACGIAADQLIRRRKKKEKAPDGTRQAE